MSGHHDHSSPIEVGNIRTAFFLNLFFAIIELIGGYFTNSVAIMSDALHDFGDSLSLGTSWYFQKIARKDRDYHFTYGYRRFSVLGAIVNSVVLTTGSVIILFEAIPRIIEPEMPITEGMFFLAIMGIAVNGLAAFRLSKGNSLNERAVYLHLLEDILGWIATLIVSIILYFYPIPILDPILSLVVSAYILFNVVKNLKMSFSIILQGAPINIEPEVIEKQITELEDVKEFHDCHIWSLDGQYNILSGHIVVDSSYSLKQMAQLKTSIRKMLADFQIQHATLEFETSEEDCDHC